MSEKKCPFMVHTTAHDCNRPYSGNELKQENAWYCALCIKGEIAHQIHGIKMGLEHGRFKIETREY